MAGSAELVRDSEDRRRLGARMAELAETAQHPALLRLVESLTRRYGECALAVLFYGSCLRGGDPYDGLVDLYLIVDRYRCANASWLKAAWNRLLPPNVFYTELADGDRKLRCKYAILSLHDLEKGCSPRWHHSYFWGRFSQPTAIAYSRDDASRAAVQASFGSAAVTFLARVLPRVPAQGSVTDLWREGLALSYRAELRAEGQGRAKQLTQANRHFYETVTRGAAELLKFDLETSGDTRGTRYRALIPRRRRIVSQLDWALRIAHGKLLSVARLIKALFTFEGGLDYIAWKLERHSGVAVEIPARVRRHPLIFIWGLFWKLYRQGVFR